MSSPGLRERKKQKTRWAIQAHALRLLDPGLFSRCRSLFVGWRLIVAELGEDREAEDGSRRRLRRRMGDQRETKKRRSQDESRNERHRRLRSGFALSGKRVHESVA